MECNQAITSSIDVKKCRKCSMDLCKNCYTKHGSVCIWCLEAAADTPLWLMKIAKILMIFSPLFGFLVPAPVPIVFLLQTNVLNWLWGFVYTAVFLMVLGILLGSAKAAALKSIVVTIPSPVTPTPVKGEVALPQPAPSKQTTTNTSITEQPYNPQLNNVQTSSPLHGSSARVQDVPLVFDIAGGNSDVTPTASTEARSPVEDPTIITQKGGSGGNDAQETHSAGGPVLETETIQADHQVIVPTSPPQDATEGEGSQSQNASISWLDSQLRDEVSREDQRLEAPMARPDGIMTDHLAPEGHESLQSSTESERHDAIQLDVQIGCAGEGEQVVQAPVEQQQREQELVHPAPASIAQEILDDKKTPDIPKQEVLDIETIAPLGEALNENKTLNIASLNQDGSGLHVEEPITDAVNVEPKPASDSRISPPIDRGNNGPSSTKCPNCGKDLIATDVVCSGCGFGLKK